MLLTSTYNELVDWVTMKNTGSDDQRETDMYPGINSFVNFVADRASVHTSGHIAGPACSVRPFEKTDTTPVGADDQTRVDHMLTRYPQAGPNYGVALCLIEAKFNTDIYYQMQAYIQMAMHSRNIYANQPHRRFLWGLTVCGTRVRVCLLGNDGIYASKYVDVSTPAGRGQFVELLVNWSLCESARLGYDSTMRHSSNGGGWDIDVFGDGMKRTYGNLVPTFCTSSLLGRHTRCFVGTAEIEGASMKFLIKDCWPHVVEDGTDGNRDEITFLREIRDKLRGDSDLDGKYPVLEMGGVVQIAGRDGRAISETTTAVVAGLGLAADVPLRAHTRIVMSPVGAPLDTVMSPDELIIVICDAMEVHTALVEQCQILHRDISIYNILVRRFGNEVGGMLIDLDNAIRMTGDNVAVRPDRTGTLPFMSIGNLETNNVKRTALDDWESALYILCWQGTLGVNIEDQEVNRRAIHTIKKWRSGSAADIAEAKRSDMDTPRALSNTVLGEFIMDEQYIELGRFAEDLHEMLFCNPRVSRLCHGSRPDKRTLKELRNGTLQLDGFYDKDVGRSITDPFARRAEIADLIVKDLMDTCAEARRAARERIANQALQETASGHPSG
ncbi:hypothetical protein H4R19_002351 [Coemansia spiralis]|nr:hypothetical protein H4R19_002351 [Coemansia spiralis]